MVEQTDWEIPTAAQPRPEDVPFDLDRTLSSVVGVRANIPADAFTASILGTERAGNGVLIADTGLVLTIGYLITEAETVWLLSNDGRAIEGHVAAYDYETGFGLIQALGRMELEPVELGSSAAARVGEKIIVAGHGGRCHSLSGWLAAKREFAGYWEYLLDEAIFTVPAHPNWGGAALLAQDGKLIGIGSLFVQHAGGEDKAVDGNMIVPIDLLKPILDEMLSYGRVQKPPRPWLGMFVAEADGRLGVAGLADKGPADQAGLQAGDLILEVAGQPVDSLAGLFRAIWSLGEAGVEVPLTVQRSEGTQQVSVVSADRLSFLKAPQLH